MKKSYSFLGLGALSLVALLSVCSCSTTMPTMYYQVYEVESTNVPKDMSDRFVYENEDVIVTYNLCCKGGDTGFLCHNKTEKILYVSLPNTFCIKNGLAYDSYWRGKTPAVGPKVIGIPPHSARRIEGFSIRDVALQCEDCTDEVNYPKKESAVQAFTESNTPMTFSNYVSYSFHKAGTDFKHFDNTFYIATMQNKEKSVAWEENPLYTQSTRRHGGDQSKKHDEQERSCREKPAKYIFKINAPNTFYNVYHECKSKSREKWYDWE